MFLNDTPERRYRNVVAFAKCSSIKTLMQGCRNIIHELGDIVGRISIWLAAVYKFIQKGLQE